MEASMRSIPAGIAGGIAGGVVFGMMMAVMDMMGMVAGLVGSTNPAVGWVVHLAISIAFGIGFAVVVGGRAQRTATTIGIGAAYGVAAWIAGALIAMPLLTGMTPFVIGRMQLMSMVGHLLFGIVLSLVHARITSVASARVLSGT